MPMSFVTIALVSSFTNIFPKFVTYANKIPEDGIKYNELTGASGLSGHH
jgi:hypothetical protein